MKKLLFLFIVILNIAFVNATLSCGFFNNNCPSDYDKLFGVSGNLAHSDDFVDSTGEIISAHVGFTDETYRKFYCCKPVIGNLGFESVPINENCPEGSSQLFYMSDYDSARIAISPSVIGQYQYKLCYSVPNRFGMLDIKTGDIDYSTFGYSCMFRIDSTIGDGKINGLVSSCDATYSGLNKYKNIVWGRLIENFDSLKCNNDCTSKLDNRVYVNCGLKVQECSNVPVSCEGSLLNVWVKHNSTHDVKCGPPWDEYKLTQRPDAKLKIESNGVCRNLLYRNYPVRVNNELVNMIIVSCNTRD
jgi:hypothetical protein